MSSGDLATWITGGLSVVAAASAAIAAWRSVRAGEDAARAATSSAAATRQANRIAARALRSLRTANQIARRDADAAEKSLATTIESARVAAEDARVAAAAERKRWLLMRLDDRLDKLAELRCHAHNASPGLREIHSELANSLRLQVERDMESGELTKEEHFHVHHRLQSTRFN
jgi:hypothetical protein